MSFDGSGWDGSLTSAILEHTELPAFEMPSGSDRLHQALRHALKELRISRLAGATRVRIRAKRRSGDTYTSIGNGIVNVQIQVAAWAFAANIPPEVVASLLVIEGDDAGILIPLVWLSAEVRHNCSIPPGPKLVHPQQC